MLFSSFAFSQAYEINGTVLDLKTGSPLPGVNVVIKNRSMATTTDFDGNFKLSKIPSGSLLVISYIGYKDYEKKVSQNENLTINLIEESNKLEEVVVIGYGNKKKKDISGAVAVLSSKTIEELKPIKVEQALQGTVSGVTVTAQSGSPGAGLDIRIRGVSTNGNNGPLVIIDGYQGNLSNLNPNDIENITVLKDAQAAIYGVIGANGVVIVNTKKGKKNSKTKVTYNNYTGFQETTKKLEVLNATEYALLLNESYANGGQALPYPNVSGLGAGTNWQDEIFKKSPIISHDFSISGGSDKITYAFSGSDLTQQGIIGESKADYKRNTARVSLGVDFSSKLKLQSNIIYTYVDRDAFNDTGLGSVLFNAINTPSTIPVYDTNGNYSLVPSSAGFGIEVINPLAQLDNTYNDYKGKGLNGGFDLNYDLTSDIKLTSRFGFNTFNSKGKTFYKQVNYGGKVFDVTRSSVSQNAINDNDYTLDLYAAYDKNFLENHHFKFTFGTTIYKQFGSGLFATGFDVPNNSWEFADISLATGTSLSGGRDVGSYSYDERRLSYFGRFEYEFKSKYLFSAMLRRDSSTKFGPTNRVAFSPSITTGWVVSEEGFFKKSKFIDFLKIRASYGRLGNDQILNNGYLGSLSGEATYVFNNTIVNGTAIGVLPNPNIKWEADEKIDFGFDANFFDKKIDVTVDYFSNTRKDLLIGSIPVSGITGVNAPGSGSPTVNAGSVRNSGIEFAINYKNKIKENFNYSIGYNFATLKNVVLEVKNSTGYIEGGSFGVGQLAPARMEVGQPLGYFYGYQTDGIFQNQGEIDTHPSQAALGAGTAPGDIRFKDLNNDGVIDTKDRTNIGSPIPSITMGFNFSINYKNFDFVTYSYASIGNEMARNYERTLSDVNKGNYLLGRWTGEGTSTSVPRVTTGATNNNVFSNYFVEDASFIRIQTIQLGYTLSQSVSEKIGINKFRFYTTVNNPFTFTKYKGFDATTSNGGPIGGGIDAGTYPSSRAFLLGVNLIF